MADKSNRLDILNRERFMDVICGDAPVDLGIVSGTYRNQPSEFLVMVLADPDEGYDEDATEVSTVPLAVFLSEEDTTYIEIPNGANIDTIEFTETLPEEEPTEVEDAIEMELLLFKPKGLPN